MVESVAPPPEKKKKTTVVVEEPEDTLVTPPAQTMQVGELADMLASIPSRRTSKRREPIDPDFESDISIDTTPGEATFHISDLVEGIPKTIAVSLADAGTPVTESFLSQLVYKTSGLAVDLVHITTLATNSAPIQIDSPGTYYMEISLPRGNEKCRKTLVVLD